jgi:hypothetical protein
MQQIHILHFFMINNVFDKTPDEEVQRSLEKEAREWVPFSYPVIRKLPVQKGTNMVGEVW